LAHAGRNKARAAYNKAQRLAERRTMMQAWADYIDVLKAGGKIIPIRREAGGRRALPDRSPIVSTVPVFNRAKEATGIRQASRGF
jgi:hypothetical protein